MESDPTVGVGPLEGAMGRCRAVRGCYGKVWGC